MHYSISTDMIDICIGMKDFVIADPYLSETRFSDYKACPLLILACDGVWDVMTDQEAVDLILDAARKNGGPFDSAAHFLVSVYTQIQQYYYINLCFLLLLYLGANCNREGKC